MNPNYRFTIDTQKKAPLVLVTVRDPNKEEKTKQVVCSGILQATEFVKLFGSGLEQEAEKRYAIPSMVPLGIQKEDAKRVLFSYYTAHPASDTLKKPTKEPVKPNSGHVKDGSSIKKHSVGNTFPYIITFVERYNVDGTRLLSKFWKVTGPGLPGPCVFTTHPDAESFASTAAKAAQKGLK